MLENKTSLSFFRKLLNSKILVTFEVIILILIAVAFGKEIIRNYQVKSQIKSLETEINSLQKENLKIADLIQYFKTDTFKEEQAKSRLGMQKEGEKVIALPSEKEEVLEPSSVGNYTNNTNKLVSNPQKWWNYFFD